MNKFSLFFLLILLSIISGNAQLNNDLFKLSDEFNNSSSLSEWNFFHIRQNLPDKIIDIGVDTSQGYLYIEPYSACWYSGYYGIYMYKETENDFVITARIKVEGKANDLPADKWSIAGILIRVPADTSVLLTERKENWVYINSGRGKEPEWVIDSKYTIDNKSVWDAIPSTNSWIELRIVRLKSLFITMYKFSSGDWQIHKKIILNEFPEKLQTGINISANAAFAFDKSFAVFNSMVYQEIIPDMKVYIDFVKYTTPIYTEEIRALLDKNNYDAVTDDCIIKNFSF